MLTFIVLVRAGLSSLPNSVATTTTTEAPIRLTEPVFLPPCDDHNWTDCLAGTAGECRNSAGLCRKHNGTCPEHFTQYCSRDTVEMYNFTPHNASVTTGTSTTTITSTMHEGHELCIFGSYSGPWHFWIDTDYGGLNANVINTSFPDIDAAECAQKCNNRVLCKAFIHRSYNANGSNCVL